MFRNVQKLLLACLLGWCAAGSTAVAGEDVARQIDREVWIPFMAAASAFDADGFLALQSKDLVRVSQDDNEVYGLDRYAREVREGFPRAKARGAKRTSEVRFLTRTHAGDLAYETGYFHSRATLANGEERRRYTRFEVVLRKEAGTWKILLDKDTQDGGAITEAMYLQAQPLSQASDKPGTSEVPEKKE